MDNPTHRVYNKRVHEWVIETPCDAATFAKNLAIIHAEMSDFGVKLDHDDAYRVSTFDKDIVLWLEWTD